MEYVLVVKTEKLSQFISGRTGLITESNAEMLDIIRAEHEFIPRPDAENDPGYKQIIPYVVLRRGDEIFMTRRLKKGGEARLHGLMSIGVCIPGSGMTKENLIGEVSANNMRAAMALNIAKQGYISVAVDNAAAGEAADLEPLTGTSYDYDTPSRILLELGWSYLGYTSFLNKQVLEWMKCQPFIRKDRIVVSGFSLGTEPLMVLGVMDPSIYAFVYNDFLCQTQERAIVMTEPDQRGRRPFPNSIRHLIPDFWKYFNFPDIVASLAPRPIILTEGGLDRDFNLVKRAYEISGHPENVETHHYQKYTAPETRNTAQNLPEGLGRASFYDSVNVDGPNHYFKNEFVLPWLDKVLAE